MQDRTGIVGGDRTAEQLQLVRALFPELAQQLDVAHEANAGASSETRFDDWLDQEAATQHAGAAFAPLADSAGAERLTAAFRAATDAAKFAGIIVPEPEAFAAAGVDLTALAAALVEDPTLLPVPSPYGLGADRWQDAFSQAVAAHGALLAQRDGASPLVLATDAAREFASLDRVPSSEVPTVVPHTRRGPKLQWTLRLIPSDSAPSLLGLGFVHGPHATLPEMLMLQLMRISAGEEPVDAGTFTWLAGTLADGKLAARHVYDAGERVIRITCREIGNQGPHLGARPPIS